MAVFWSYFLNLGFCWGTENRGLIRIQIFFSEVFQTTIIILDLFKQKKKGGGGKKGAFF